jgi:hypothetical protein
MWKHRDHPGEWYIDAIRRGYDRAEACGKQVTPADIWNSVIIECLHRPGGFAAMFAWDRRKHVNRVRDIAEAIEAGLVPGLRLDGGNKVVVDAQL